MLALVAAGPPLVASMVASTAVTPSRPALQRSELKQPELDQWREYEVLRGDLDKDTLKGFFAKRPQAIAGRLWKIYQTVSTAKRDWEAADDGLAAGEKSDEFDPTKDVRDQENVAGTRGAKLCEQMASLGPVSVKVCQTLAQRPDLVGDEAATCFKRLQTSNVPYDDSLAWAVIKESLGHSGPVAPGTAALAGRKKTQKRQPCSHCELQALLCYTNAHTGGPQKEPSVCPWGNSLYQC